MSTRLRQSARFRRGHSVRLAVGAAMAASACSGAAVVAMPTRDEVIAANVDAGTDEAVAECLVGIGQGELPLDQLLPDAERTPLDELLVNELTDSCEEAANFVSQGDDPPDELAFEDGPFTYGEDAELDALWDNCLEGVGVDCDELWANAPIGSDYERFGVSCGDRPQVFDCSVDLTPETVEEIDASAAARADDADDADDSPT